MHRSGRGRERGRAGQFLLNSVSKRFRQTPTLPPGCDCSRALSFVLSTHPRQSKTLHIEDLNNVLPIFLEINGIHVRGLGVGSFPDHGSGFCSTDHHSRRVRTYPRPVPPNMNLWRDRVMPPKYPHYPLRR